MYMYESLRSTFVKLPIIYSRVANIYIDQIRDLLNKRSPNPGVAK
jgi:hypothetical protein